MGTEGKWSFFFPDEGGDEGDALTITRPVYDAKDAARWAVKYDFEHREGWERGEREFPIVVISPDGKQTQFFGWHQKTIEHRARKDES